jgi:hypothetical protein
MMRIPREIKANGRTENYEIIRSTLEIAAATTAAAADDDLLAHYCHNKNQINLLEYMKKAVAYYKH